ncbi:MAG: hypothetical protein ABUL41_00130 [Chitinophagaceae bacterium]
MKKIINGILPMLPATFLLFSFFAFSAFNNSASAQAWEKLGQRKVNFRSDRDEISGRWDGWFKAIQIKVREGTINMQKMVVHYRNGQTEDIPLKNNFSDGGESRIIDLPGKSRLIDKVVFWYESTSSSDGNKPIVELWGRH